jgi:hypothetical protein
MAGRSQEALYAEIDLELSWSERELPQSERTKHVHRLHPYLGKFIPQLVEVFLRRHFAPGDCVYDPFVGSGTTLVEANGFGADAIGCDISAFNCLLSRVKTAQYSLGSLEMSLRATLEEARRVGPAEIAGTSPWLRKWYAPQALGELLRYRDIARERLDGHAADVAWVILSRAARSARLTSHFDLDFPRVPMREPYHCHKHSRECRPVEEADKFLVRYTSDTVRRLRAFAPVQTARRVKVLHADSRFVDLDPHPSGVITSPPYPGLIDYHEQHRYAYELLGLEDKRTEEIGSAERGTSKVALRRYVEDMVAVFKRTSEQLAAGSPVVIVVNDSRLLYPEILNGSGMEVDDRHTRHVNRRTGRRAGEFYEEVIVCRVAG